MNQAPNQEKDALNTKPTKVEKAPKGWIRWSGLVLVLLVIALIVAGGYVYSNFMLKNKIETLASEAWGAKVEVQSVRIGFDPLGIRIEKLAVTDPEQPMQNLFVMDDITLTINLYHLVLKRFVVEDLRLQGLALNVPRQTSGALPFKPRSEAQVTDASDKKSFELPSIDLPSSDDILARERLETLELAEGLKTQTEQAKQQWQAIEQRLPTKQRLDDYKADIDRVFDGSVRDLEDLKQRQQALQALQQRWVNDRLAVHEAQQFIRTQSRDLKQGVEDLVDMPKQDVKRIMETYSFDEEGLANITFLLFGEGMQQKLNTALDWYRKASPLIEWVAQYRADKAQEQPVKPPRLQGEDIKFVEYDQQPKFMIKRIDFDGQLAWGNLSLHLRDVHTDQAFTQKPVRFKFAAKPQTQANGLELEGQISGLDQPRASTDFVALWEDYQVRDWQMSGSSRLPVTLRQATNHVSASGKLEGMSRLNLDMLFDFQQVQFDLSHSASKDVTRYIAPAFEAIDAFKVEAGVSGRLYSPRLSASSDLDTRLTAGFKQVFQQELAQLRQELERKLREELAVYQQELEQRLADYGIDQTKVREIEANLRNIEDYAAQQAKEAEQALRQRIRQETEKLEREARAKLEQAEQQARERLAEEEAKLRLVEQEAKRKADEEKARLEREAKQKLEQELRQRLRF